MNEQQYWRSLMSSMAGIGSLLNPENEAENAAYTPTCPNCGYTCNLSPRERRGYEARIALLSARCASLEAVLRSKICTRECACCDDIKRALQEDKPHE